MSPIINSYVKELNNTDAKKINKDIFEEQHLIQLTKTVISSITG